jgi:hypothetical protein
MFFPDMSRSTRIFLRHRLSRSDLEVYYLAARTEEDTPPWILLEGIHLADPALDSVAVGARASEPGSRPSSGGDYVLGSSVRVSCHGEEGPPSFSEGAECPASPHETVTVAACKVTPPVIAGA